MKHTKTININTKANIIYMLFIIIMTTALPAACSRPAPSADRPPSGSATMHTSGIATSRAAATNTSTSTSVTKSKPKPSFLPKGTDDTLTFVVNDDRHFTIYSEFNDNYMVALAFQRKDWGTWNILGWRLVDRKDFLLRKPVPLTDFYPDLTDKSSDYNTFNPFKEPDAGNHLIMTGDGTDFEYVFRVGPSGTGNFFFAGGNHKNEQMTSISIKAYSAYDEYNTTLSLAAGTVAENLRQLIITEKTILHSEEHGITGIAEITRKYTIEPRTVSLYTGIDFKKDIWLGTSYVAMMPVMKDFGRHFKFGDRPVIYTTPPSGVTHTSPGNDNYIGMVDELSLIAWGDWDPGIKLKVSIASDAMTRNYDNELKLFVWDLNQWQNKAYFTRNDSKNPEFIPAGTFLNLLATWDISYSP